MYDRVGVQWAVDGRVRDVGRGRVSFADLGVPPAGLAVGAPWRSSLVSTSEASSSEPVATSTTPKPCATTNSTPLAVARRNPDSAWRASPLAASRVLLVQRASGLPGTGSIARCS